MGLYSFHGLGYEQVCFYDHERKFGFLQDKFRHGPKVFFHLNDGRAAFIDPLKDEVFFGTAPVTREPKVGEYLIFREGKNDKGPKALQWVYHDELAALRDVLPDYRIRKVRTDPVRGTMLTEAEFYYWWLNICVLNSSFARGGNGGLPKFLPPNGGVDEHGSFTTVWERGTNHGAYNHYERAGWVICEDPRHESLR